MTEKETKTNLRHIHISAEKPRLALNLREVWEYRELIWLFTRRNFLVRYKQTILGPAWLVLNPLLSSLMYAFVFGEIAGIGTDGVPGLLFYLCSNAVWSFFSAAVRQNAGVFTANAAVFGKVYFPRLTMPVSNVLSAAIQFGVQRSLVLVFLLHFLIRGAVSPNWGGWLLIPAVLVQLGLLALGLGVLLSGLTAKYRDLAIAVDFGIQLWMFATPIAYPLSEIPAGWMGTAVRLNPVTMPVELLRWALLGRGSVEWLYYGIGWAVTVLMVLLGVLVFNRVEKTFLDTV